MPKALNLLRKMLENNNSCANIDEKIRKDALFIAEAENLICEHNKKVGRATIDSVVHYEFGRHERRCESRSKQKPLQLSCNGSNYFLR